MPCADPGIECFTELERNREKVRSLKNLLTQNSNFLQTSNAELVDSAALRTLCQDLINNESRLLKNELNYKSEIGLLETEKKFFTDHINALTNMLCEACGLLNDDNNLYKKLSRKTKSWHKSHKEEDDVTSIIYHNLLEARKNLLELCSEIELRNNQIKEVHNNAFKNLPNNKETYSIYTPTNGSDNIIKISNLANASDLQLEEVARKAAGQIKNKKKEKKNDF